MNNVQNSSSIDISDFAGNILFSPSLSVKMTKFTHFTDDKKSSITKTPAEPARDKHLRLPGISQKSQKAKFPGLRDLETMYGRATALHFFANHELLALELMALAILRFPDAPEGFRMGIAHTMSEEQDHLRLYLDYMRQGQMEFGDLQLNRFFWDVLSPMKTPFDYVAGMSLTFEQANLDFSLQYQQLFNMVGDQESSAVLQKVYEDEIGHVKHGLTWFRKWKDQNLSDWDAYQRSLKLPLSPTRAKGQVYSIPARQACGLDSDFIRQLQFTQQSKGRPPDVYVFNPSFEDELAHGSHSYVARKPLQLFATDYASMMTLMTKGGDIVLADQKPDLRWLELLSKVGFTTPEFLTLEKLLQSNRRIGSIVPWGNSPQLQQRFQVIKQYRQAQPDHEAQTQPIMKELHSKVFATRLTKQLYPDDGQDHLLGVYSDDSTAELAIMQHFLTSSQYLVLKAPLGASGRNTIRLMQPPSTNELAWIKNMLSNQHYLVIEKWQQRCLDLSTQIYVRGSTKDTIKVHGVTHMLTDWRGQYIGHHIGSRFANLTPELKQFFAKADVLGTLTSVGKQVGEILGKQGYRGPCGIDSYIHIDQPDALGSTFRLRPVVELNTRYTMGSVALLLQKKICHGTPAIWLHLNSKHRALLGYSSWEEFDTHLQEITPLCIKNDLVKNGVIPTNDPFTAQECLGILFVGSAYNYGLMILEKCFKLKEKAGGNNAPDSSHKQ